MPAALYLERDADGADGDGNGEEDEVARALRNAPKSAEKGRSGAQELKEHRERERER